jgi:hypothetical protein
MLNSLSLNVSNLPIIIVKNMLSFNISVVDIVIAIAIVTLLLLHMTRTPKKYTAEPELPREKMKLIDESRKNSAIPKTSKRRPQTSPQPQKPVVVAFCPQCKSRIPLESKFCLECGTSLQPEITA